MIKRFVITIDTESDNQWNCTNTQKTENAHYIPRFQELCESYGFKPTYLVDYTMGADEFLVKYLKTLNLSDKCEVGMHLHAWDTPPKHEMDLSISGRPYLIEYPEEVMENKIEAITRSLEEQFESKMASHRAGRWATNLLYLRLLERYGYRIDCSFTPGIDWSKQKGHAVGGTNYQSENAIIHRINECNKLIEVPLTIGKIRTKHISMNSGIKNFLKTAYQSIFGKRVWVRPSISNIEDILQLVSDISNEDSEYIEFMMHSSEFMPGGSPYYKTQEDINRLYSMLDILFQRITTLNYEGSTLRAIGAMVEEGEINV